jgi:hypothetical protein
MWEDNALFAGGKGNNRAIQTLKSGSVYVSGDKYDDFALGVVAVAMAVLLI